MSLKHSYIFVEAHIMYFDICLIFHKIQRTNLSKEGLLHGCASTIKTLFPSHSSN
jgi:hypothetical protein